MNTVIADARAREGQPRKDNRYIIFISIIAVTKILRKITSPRCSRSSKPSDLSLRHQEQTPLPPPVPQSRPQLKSHRRHPPLYSTPLQMMRIAYQLSAAATVSVITAPAMCQGAGAGASEEANDRLARWQARWTTTEAAGSKPAWHLGRAPHPRLVEFQHLMLPSAGAAAAKVMIPLAGASHDVAYLATADKSQVQEVVAVEGVKLAVDAFAKDYAGKCGQFWRRWIDSADAALRSRGKPKPRYVRVAPDCRNKTTWVIGDFLSLKNETGTSNRSSIRRQS